MLEAVGGEVRASEGCSRDEIKLDIREMLKKSRGDVEICTVLPVQL
jgi:hypothetical protein